MVDKELQLDDGSRVGVIGGGPAGSFFSIFLLDLAERMGMDIQGDEEQEIRLGVRGEGEFFGEMAIFDRDVRSATVRALGDARVLTVDKKNFMRRVHEDPSLAFRLVETMSRRIRELGEEVARLQNAR
ncbi:MAG TPA: cyclic nucleotide-binding domain-containing protein [Anaerolineales bacterium]|nr:cyclic nucleotide-binding domain-containing protein [Anaerolineales bacterium]HUV27568.1 cyclic nucleotide-binding domain-containing protein [Anaerolineales bacterium]